MSSGAPSPPSSPNKPPVPIELPNLTARAAADAIEVLNDLGLKSKAVTVHSNAAAEGRVISTMPAAASKDVDANLSPAKGATSIEITVRAGASPDSDWAVWQDLRLEPQVE